MVDIFNSLRNELSLFKEECGFDVILSDFDASAPLEDSFSELIKSVGSVRASCKLNLQKKQNRLTDLKSKANVQIDRLKKLVKKERAQRRELEQKMKQAAESTNQSPPEVQNDDVTQAPNQPPFVITPAALEELKAKLKQYQDQNEEMKTQYEAFKTQSEESGKKLRAEFESIQAENSALLEELASLKASGAVEIVKVGNDSSELSQKLAIAQRELQTRDALRKVLEQDAEHAKLELESVQTSHTVEMEGLMAQLKAAKAAKSALEEAKMKLLDKIEKFESDGNPYEDEMLELVERVEELEKTGKAVSKALEEKTDEAQQAQTLCATLKVDNDKLHQEFMVLSKDIVNEQHEIHAKILQVSQENLKESEEISAIVSQQREIHDSIVQVSKENLKESEELKHVGKLLEAQEKLLSEIKQGGIASKPSVGVAEGLVAEQSKDDFKAVSAQLERIGHGSEDILAAIEKVHVDLVEKISAPLPSDSEPKVDLDPLFEKLNTRVNDIYKRFKKIVRTQSIDVSPFMDQMNRSLSEFQESIKAHSSESFPMDRMDAIFERIALRDEELLQVIKMINSQISSQVKSSDSDPVLEKVDDSFKSILEKIDSRNEEVLNELKKVAANLESSGESRGSGEALEKIDAIHSKLDDSFKSILEKIDSRNEEVSNELKKVTASGESSGESLGAGEILEKIDAINSSINGGPEGESILASMFGHMRKLVRQIPSVKKVVTAETERTNNELLMKITELLDGKTIQEGVVKAVASEEIKKSEYKEKISALETELKAVNAQKEEIWKELTRCRDQLTSSKDSESTDTKFVAELSKITEEHKKQRTILEKKCESLEEKHMALEAQFEEVTASLVKAQINLAKELQRKTYLEKQVEEQKALNKQMAAEKIDSAKIKQRCSDLEAENEKLRTSESELMGKILKRLDALNAERPSLRNSETDMGKTIAPNIRDAETATDSTAKEETKEKKPALTENAAATENLVEESKEVKESEESSKRTSRTQPRERRQIVRKTRVKQDRMDGAFGRQRTSRRAPQRRVKSSKEKKKEKIEQKEEEQKVEETQEKVEDKKTEEGKAEEEEGDRKEPEVEEVKKPEEVKESEKSPVMEEKSTEPSKTEDSPALVSMIQSQKRALLQVHMDLTKLAQVQGIKLPRCMKTTPAFASPIKEPVSVVFGSKSFEVDKASILKEKGTVLNAMLEKEQPLNIAKEFEFAPNLLEYYTNNGRIDTKCDDLFLLREESLQLAIPPTNVWGAIFESLVPFVQNQKDVFSTVYNIQPLCDLLDNNITLIEEPSPTIKAVSTPSSFMDSVLSPVWLLLDSMLDTRTAALLRVAIGCPESAPNRFDLLYNLQDLPTRHLSGAVLYNLLMMTLLDLEEDLRASKKRSDYQTTLMWLQHLRKLAEALRTAEYDFTLCNKTLYSSKRTIKVNFNQQMLYEVSDGKWEVLKPGEKKNAEGKKKMPPKKQRKTIKSLYQKNVARKTKKAKGKLKKPALPVDLTTALAPGESSDDKPLTAVEQFGRNRIILKKIQTLLTRSLDSPQTSKRASLFIPTTCLFIACVVILWSLFIHSGLNCSR